MTEDTPEGPVMSESTAWNLKKDVAPNEFLMIRLTSSLDRNYEHPQFLDQLDFRIRYSQLFV